MIPCVYALMNRRRIREYNYVIKAVKTAARNLKLKLNPKSFMTDFEQAAIVSFKDQFKGI